jgi:steroid delta-isomerase-like uncharacterized protein
MSGESKMDANKALIREYTRMVFNEHDGAASVEFMAVDAQWHGGTLGTITGAASIAGMLTGFFAALPDLVATEQAMLADETGVAVRFVVEGTHQGELFGIPATGRAVRWDAIDVYRISHGKILEEWAADDMIAVLHQVGAFTPPWLAGIET